jgi:hypothetical protein
MDPISMVVAALTAGAGAAGGAAISAAAEDAYRTLKEKVQARFSGNDRAVQVVNDHAEDPQVWEAPLRKYLQQAQAAHDDELVATAQQVLTLVDAKGAKAGKYVVDACGAQGVTIGDHATVTQTFNAPPPQG